MKGPSAIRLIAGREIRDRLRAKSFAVLTGLLVVLILAIGIVARVVAATTPPPSRSSWVSQSRSLPGWPTRSTPAAVPIDREVTVTAIEPGSTRRALEDGDVDAVVVTSERRVVYADEVDAETQAIVQQAWAGAELSVALSEAGVTSDQADEIVTADPLAATTLEGDDDDTGLVVLTGTVTAVLLFLSLQIFGNYALTGVVEEKSSAVVELLLVRVRSDELLAGKLVGHRCRGAGAVRGGSRGRAGGAGDLGRRRARRDLVGAPDVAGVVPRGLRPLLHVVRPGRVAGQPAGGRPGGGGSRSSRSWSRPTS